MVGVWGTFVYSLSQQMLIQNLRCQAPCQVAGDTAAKSTDEMATPQNIDFMGTAVSESRDEALTAWEKWGGT